MRFPIFSSLLGLQLFAGVLSHPTLVDKADQLQFLQHEKRNVVPDSSSPFSVAPANEIKGIAAEYPDRKTQLKELLRE